MNNEPVAWMRKSGEEVFFSKTDHSTSRKWFPLYIHPVKELTDKEIRECIHQIDPNKTDMFMSFARAILRKAQEK